MSLAQLRLIMLAYALCAGMLIALLLPVFMDDANTLLHPQPSLEIPLDINDRVTRTPPVPAVVPADPDPNR